MRETTTVLNLSPPEGMELNSEINSYRLSNLVLAYKGGAYDPSTLKLGGEMENVAVLVNGVPCYNLDQTPLRDGDVITTMRPGISTFKPVPISSNTSSLLKIEKATNGFGKYTLSASFLTPYVSDGDYAKLNNAKLFGVLTPTGDNWTTNVSANLDLKNSKVVYENVDVFYSDQTDSNGNPIFRTKEIPWSSYKEEGYTVEKNGTTYLNPYKVGGAGAGVSDYDAAKLYLGNARLGDGAFAVKASNNRYIIRSEGVSVVKIMTVSYDTNGKVTDISASDEKVVTILEPYVGHAKENQKIFIWGAKVLQEPTFKPLCEPLSF